MNDSIPLRDRQKTISLNSFNEKVGSCYQWLRTHPLNEIPDSIHIEIMYCLNTIFMAHDKKFQRRFNQENYQKLVSLTEEIKYTDELIKVYKEWIPNRGMGFYFPALNMELYGTPSLYAWYQVLYDQSTSNTNR